MALLGRATLSILTTRGLLRSVGTIFPERPDMAVEQRDIPHVALQPG
jgi:hypothetical protein